LQLAFGEEAAAARRADGAGFEVATRSAPAGARTHRAANLVFATGYYDHPNRLGVPGEDLPHVFHYYDEPHPFWRKRVVVVGGKNSAAIAALELHRAGASVTLVHRGERLSDSIKYWIRPDIENRIKEGSIAARFATCVTAIREGAVAVRGSAGPAEIEADAVFLLVGYHPDPTLLRSLGVEVGDDLKPAYDPATFETNVRGVFVAGSVVSGRDTNRIFIENGRFHGEAIVGTIAARRR
jgi:thioredoxin reductase (NADPH)